MNAGVFLVTFRESFEGFLIVAILLSLFYKADNRRAANYVLAGGVAGAIGALLFSMIASYIYGMFDGMGQDILQAVIFLLAAIVITTVVIFLGKARYAGLKSTVEKYSDSTALYGLAVIGFIMIFREGVEMALFLAGIIFQTGDAGTTTFFFGIGGIVAALLLAVGIYALGLKLPLKLFFTATSIFLIFLGAGMAAAGIGKLVEIDLLPAIQYEVWNSNWLMSEHSSIGKFFHTLLGYNANPTMTEALTYGVCLSALFYLYYRQNRKRSSQSAT